MIYPKIPLAQTVIQLCKAKHIKHIIISPGSRSAPLTIGFTNDDFFKCYSIVDERCAAFFAMGIAQQLKAPTALVCTSGSALLNYYPAVAEAFYSDIPLVVLSADRPKYLIGIGDGQTINQKNVYDNHILYSANLKLDITDEKNTPSYDELPIMKNLENKLERFLGLQEDIQAYNEQEINKAINISKLKKGPVHINIPFDEPLYETVDTLTVAPKNIEFKPSENSIDTFDLKTRIEDWSTASKKMILVGVHQPDEINDQYFEELAKDDSVIVLTETTSNIHHESFFPSIDQLIGPLSKVEQQQLQPDILLTFGGLVVSKKIKALLRKFKPKAHWHIDENKANDTFFCLTHHIEVTPQLFFKSFIPNITRYKQSSYKPLWLKVKSHRLTKHKTYIQDIPFSDFKAFDTILKVIPDNTILQVGNSSAIRYTQLFSINKTLEVFCNRGTSGIDGSTSTAIGCAVANTKATTCITGDLSFFYDSNALWNTYIPNTFRIILINNEGGGIFRILPGHKNTDNFNTYFETRHHLNAKHLCQMFNFEYFIAADNETLKNVLSSFFKPSQTPKLLEVFTPQDINDEILLDYFNAVK